MSDKKETERRETMEDRQRPSYVVVIEAARDDRTERITQVLGPHPLWKAEKVDGGININLNHDAYFTLILTKEDLDRRRADEKKKESPA
jgi:hypothetical protein